MSTHNIFFLLNNKINISSFWTGLFWISGLSIRDYSHPCYRKFSRLKVISSLFVLFISAGLWDSSWTEWVCLPAIS